MDVFAAQHYYDSGRDWPDLEGFTGLADITPAEQQELEDVVRQAEQEHNTAYAGRVVTDDDGLDPATPAGKLTVAVFDAVAAIEKRRDAGAQE